MIGKSGRGRLESSKVELKDKREPKIVALSMGETAIVSLVRKKITKLQ